MPRVKSVSRTEIVFEVDDEDIRLAIAAQLRPNYDSTFDDPIAQALKRIGHYRQVYVGWFSATGYKGPVRHEYRILNSDQVRDFLSAYMHGRPLGHIEVKLFFEQEVRTDNRWGMKKPLKKESTIKGKIIP